MAQAFEAHAEAKRKVEGKQEKRRLPVASAQPRFAPPPASLRCLPPPSLHFLSPRPLCSDIHSSFNFSSPP
eukprot:1381788-Pleurochrysis_carterae.AAC.1